MTSEAEREDKESEEIRQIIEEAVRAHLQLRPLTPALLRQVADAWVDGRNQTVAAREAYRASGIIASMKNEYLVPDYLKEPLYSEVLRVMVERGEWDTEPSTNIPKYKRTPTINYSFRVEGNHGDLIDAPKYLKS